MVEEGSTSENNDVEMLIVKNGDALHEVDEPDNIDSEFYKDLDDDGMETDKDEEKSEAEPEIGWRNMSRKLNVLLAGLCLSRFLYYAAFSMIAPFFPDEAAEHGVNDLVNGLIFSSYSITAVIVSPLCGRLVPFVGARFGYLGGMFGAGITTLAYGLLDEIPNDKTTAFTFWAFVIRIFEAFFSVVSVNASTAIIFHSYPLSVQSTIMGITNMFFGAGLTAGPLLGGILYDLGGYKLPFFVIGALILLSVPLNCFVVDKNIDTIRETSSVVEMFKTAPGVCFPAMARMTTGIVNSFILPILSSYLTTQYNITSKTKQGLIFSLMTLGYVVGSPIWGWIGDKKGLLRWAILIGLIGISIDCFFLGPCPWFDIPNYLWLLALTLFLIGFGAAVGVIVIVDIMEKCKSNGMEETLALGALVSGVYYCAYFLGTAIGPILGGAFYALWGWGWTTTAAGFICILTSLIYAAYMIHETIREKRRKAYGDLEGQEAITKEFELNNDFGDENGKLNYGLNDENEKVPISKAYPHYTEEE